LGISSSPSSFKVMGSVSRSQQVCTPLRRGLIKKVEMLTSLQKETGSWFTGKRCCRCAESHFLCILSDVMLINTWYKVFLIKSLHPKLVEPLVNDDDMFLSTVVGCGYQ